MSRDLTLAMRLYADASRFVGGLRQGSRGMESFVSQGKRQINDLKGHLGSLNGMLAGLGLGVGMGAMLKQAAELDKGLVNLRNSTGASSMAVRALRSDLFEASKTTGVDLDELKRGMDALAAGGLSVSEAQSVLMPMAKTMAVFPTNAEELARAMGVASQQFGINLKDVKSATLLLDQMAVAGNLGNAELGNLPDIFAAVGGTAKAANFDIQQTLALIETLSLSEPNAARVADLGRSTLNMFANVAYKQQVSKATGIKFYDGKNLRDPIKILTDLKKQYDSIAGDAGKEAWFHKAFKGMDSNTIIGMRSVLNDKSFAKLAEVSNAIRNSSGEVARKLPTAIDTAITRTNQLKAALREAGDEFARPILDAYSNLTGFLVDSQDKGGLGLTGKEMAIGAGTVVAGSYAIAKMGGWLGDLLRRRPGGGGPGGIGGPLGNLLGGAPALAGGIAMGKLVEQMGVQPVFVVNMPGSGIGGPGGGPVPPVPPGAPGSQGGWIVGGLRNARMLAGLGMADIAGLGAGAMALSAAMVAAAGAIGYGTGTLIHKTMLEGTESGDTLGGTIATILAWGGNKTAKEAINNTLNGLSGTLDLNIKVDSEGRATVQPPGPVALEPSNRNRSYRGPLMWGN